MNKGHIYKGLKLIKKSKIALLVFLKSSKNNTVFRQKRPGIFKRKLWEISGKECAKNGLLCPFHYGLKIANLLESNIAKVPINS